MKWTKVKRPVYVLVSLVTICLLWWLPFPSLLKYAGSIITILGALGGYWHKLRVEKQKDPGERTSLDADLFAMCVVIAGAIVSMASSHSDDITKKKDEAIQQKKDSDRQKRFDEVAIDQKQREDQLLRDTHKANEALALANKKMELASRESQLAHRETLLAHRETQLARSEIRAARKENIWLAKQGQFVTTAQGQLTRLEVASESIKGFNANLRNFERTINPIQTADLSFTVRIPLDDPSLQGYRANLLGKLQKYIASGKLNTNDPHTSDFVGLYRYLVVDRTGHLNIKYGISIQKGSDLFPSDGDHFPGSLFSYQLQMLFWHKSQNVSQSLTPPNWNTIPTADMRVVTLTSMKDPELVYIPREDSLHLTYQLTIPVAKISRRIATIPDLLGSRVIVRRYIYRDKNGAILLTPHISDIEKKCRVEQIQFTVSGSPFEFEEKDLNYFNDADCGIACQFIFSDTRSIVEVFKNAINE